MYFVIQPKRKHNQQYEGENINNSIKVVQVVAHKLHSNIFGSLIDVG